MTGVVLMSVCGVHESARRPMIAIWRGFSKNAVGQKCFREIKNKTEKDTSHKKKLISRSNLALVNYFLYVLEQLLPSLWMVFVAAYLQSLREKSSCKKSIRRSQKSGWTNT